MPWDVSKPVAEVNHDFEKAIPKEAKTWVRIDKVRPGANAIMEATLSDATLVYRAGEVQQRQTVHWELVKFTACWLTLVETNFEKDGERSSRRARSAARKCPRMPSPRLEPAPAARDHRRVDGGGPATQPAVV